MSFGDRAGTADIMARADEFEERAVNEIREKDNRWTDLYISARGRGRFELEALWFVLMLTWHKAEDIFFIQSFNGTLTMEDIRCFAALIEENVTAGIDYLTRGAVQYGVIRTVESLRRIGEFSVSIFAVNTCGLDDPSVEKVNRGLEDIRQLITAEDLIDHDIFSKKFLIFPIHRSVHSACIVILNPGALLARNNGPNRGECHYYEIGTSTLGNDVIRAHINAILDSYRIGHERGPFRRGIFDGVPYDEKKLIVIPPLPVQGKYNNQFQLFYILKKLLENGTRIEDYLAYDVEKIGKERYEMLKEVKLIRQNILSEISLDIIRDGTDFQKYLHERRMREIETQEHERERAIENGDSERIIRREWDLQYPSTDSVNQWESITEIEE